MELKNFEQKPEKETFVFPDINKEMGEIERTSTNYNPKDPEVFIRAFIEKAKESRLFNLTEEMWSELENTDSFDILKDNFEKVKEHTEYYNKETSSNRDWQDLKQKMEQGQELDAPIILKYLNKLHLVSGNTRLMLARALGKTPKVLLVEMEDINS